MASAELLFRGSLGLETIKQVKVYKMSAQQIPDNVATDEGSCPFDLPERSVRMKIQQKLLRRNLRSVRNGKTSSLSMI